MSERLPLPRKERLLILILGAVALFLAHCAALLFRVQPAVSLWFPPSGVAIALTLWFGPIGAVLTGLVSIAIAPAWGNDGWRQLAGIVDAVEPLVAWWLFSRVSRRSLGLETLKDVGAFLLSAPLSACAASALVGSTTLALIGAMPWSAVSGSVLPWWLGNAIGVMTITPLALLTGTPCLSYRQQRISSSDPVASPLMRVLSQFLNLTPRLRAEAATIALLGAAIALLSVSHANNTGFTFQQFSFLNFVPILWAAARFGAIGGVMSASFCVLATVASYSVAYSAGLLVLHLNVNPDVVSVHKLSLLVQSCVGLLLGTAIAQHTHAQVELAIAQVKMQEHQARSQLNETLVQTNRALEIINAQLQQVNRDKDDLLVREQAARSQAEAANRVKDEFLAVLSHELRTPLNPILGWAKLLQTRTPDEATTKRALGTIERNAKLQAQLIEDLLDVSRILQGKITLNLVPVNLAVVIQAALETVQLSAAAKAIDITFTPLESALTEPLSKAVSGDPNRLQQVVWNLLTNAVKFTPEGGRVTIVLEYKSLEHSPLEQRGLARTQSADQRGEEPAQNAGASIFCASEGSQILDYAQIDYAQITVTDTGKGIDPAFLPHVFEHFRQEDGSTTRTFGGLGLGLAIARHLVELHQGSVEAYSDGEDRGATFIVKLPLLKSGDSTPSRTAAPEPTTRRLPLAGLRILVVDDEADTRDLLHYILNAEGAIVTVAASAHEAIALLEHAPMDLVVSDISMPDVDGYALIRQIRQLPMGAKISAIALTANARDDDRDAAIAAGFDAHLAKPVAPTDLVRRVASFTSTSFSRAAR